MGFWHTGYIEFHEESGVEPWQSPAPIRYPCPLCDAVFEAPDELRQHRFEKHPFTQPTLTIRDVQLGATPFPISEARKPSDFVSNLCDSATVNGKVVATKALGKLLATYQNDRVTVRLSNVGASATFELLFRIADEDDLVGVEAAFKRLASTRHLDIRAIEGFITEAKTHKTSARYADGICQYLYGVLAKERAPDSHIPYTTYQEKFSQAADALSEYDRPIARQIRALVAFHFNHFSDAALLAPGGRIGTVARWYALLLKGKNGQNPVPSSRAGLEEMLTDFETGRILSWALPGTANIKSHVSDAEAVLSQEISAFDRLKVIMILAESCAANDEQVKARRFARELVNNVSTRIWAQTLLEKLSMGKPI